MDSNASASLSATQPAPSAPLPPPKAILSNSSSFPIRAPPTADFSIQDDDDKDVVKSSISGSDEGSEAGESFVSGEEDFETASERPFVPDPDEISSEIADEDDSFTTKRNMPIAQLSGEDDDVILDDERFPSDGEDDGFSGVVRVPPLPESSDEQNSGIRVSGAVGSEEEVNPSFENAPLEFVEKPVVGRVMDMETVERDELIEPTSPAPAPAIIEDSNPSETVEDGVFDGEGRAPSVGLDSDENLVVLQSNLVGNGDIDVAKDLEEVTEVTKGENAHQVCDESPKADELVVGATTGDVAEEEKDGVDRTYSAGGNFVVKAELEPAILAPEESKAPERPVEELQSEENEALISEATTLDQNFEAKRDSVVESKHTDLVPSDVGSDVEADATKAYESPVEESVIEKTEVLGSGSDEATQITEKMVDSHSIRNINEDIDHGSFVQELEMLEQESQQSSTEVVEMDKLENLVGESRLVEGVEDKSPSVLDVMDIDEATGEGAPDSCLITNEEKQICEFDAASPDLEAKLEEPMPTPDSCLITNEEKHICEFDAVSPDLETKLEPMPTPDSCLITNEEKQICEFDAASPDLEAKLEEPMPTPNSCLITNEEKQICEFDPASPDLEAKLEEPMPVSAIEEEGRDSESLEKDDKTLESTVLTPNGDAFKSVHGDGLKDEISGDNHMLKSTVAVPDEDKSVVDDGEESPVTDEMETNGSSETAEQIIKEMAQASSSSQDYSNMIDGQVILDSDEEVDTDDEGDQKELFDSAALAALLKAASSAAPDRSITMDSADGPARFFSVERPAGLGSSVPSLKPAARPMRPYIFNPSELAVVGEDDSNMDEEEKKLQEKIHQIRVKFLRLVQRLGLSHEETVAAQVLYRLNLAEGIRRGRHTSRAFSLESAKNAAMQLESSGDDDLDFAFNVLIIGKTGVGKSATINSIFGEEKAPISAFEPTTVGVKEITGTIDGVKVRVIDTPGLKSSVMDQGLNRKILASIKKFTKKCPPDIVLYVDRLDTQTRDFNDIPLLRSISAILGSSIWLNAIVALTHAASAPPDGPNGSPLSYEVFVAQRSHIVQHSIRQAAGDMRLMNPVALVENHPSCRRSRGQRVLPNGQMWRPQLLLLCYSSKILSEANSLLKLQDSSAGKLFGFRVRSPPLPFLLSSLLQSRPHPKLSNDQGGENDDSDIDLADLSDSDQEGEDEYDQLPFKPLRKAQIAKLSKEQRNAYFDEYEYRVKLLQKKQWRDELKRLKELKKRKKEGRPDFEYADMGEDFDQENGAPAAVPVPLPDMVLPPSFDGDNPGFRYRFLEPTSGLLTRPVLDTHGWDHDCGYDGVSLEENLAIVSQFPAAVAVQITKDKKEFNIHLDSSVSAKYGESGSSLAGFDIQTVGKQLAYILRAETKFKNLKRNKTVAGASVTFLGENVATGLKIEDQISIGKRVSLVGSTGAMRSQGDVAYGANLEARLKDKDFPIGQDQSTLGLSLMRWRGDLALGANLQSQFSVGRNSKIALRVGLNNKLSGQITVRTSSSEQLQIALVGLLPIAATIIKTIWPSESYFVH